MSRELRFLDNPRGLVEISSRTQHGRFLLCPSEKVNDLILGVLGRAQAMYGVALHAFIFMSNHFHLLATMSSAEQMSLFTGFFKGNLAKEIGRLRDWRETFWGRRYHSASVKETEQCCSHRHHADFRAGFRRAPGLATLRTAGPARDGSQRWQLAARFAALLTRCAVLRCSESRSGTFSSRR